MKDELNRKALEAFRSFSLPTRTTLDGLVERVGQLRHRRIVVVETSVLSGKSVCGLWVPRELVDVIYHAKTHGALHRQQMILHELSHMVLGHDEDPVAAGQGVAMFKEVSSEVVERALARGNFRSDVEVTAEYLADHFASAIRQGGREIYDYEAVFE